MQVSYRTRRPIPSVGRGIPFSAHPERRQSRFPGWATPSRRPDVSRRTVCVRPRGGPTAASIHEALVAAKAPRKIATKDWHAGCTQVRREMRKHSSSPRNSAPDESSFRIFTQGQGEDCVSSRSPALHECTGQGHCKTGSSVASNLQAGQKCLHKTHSAGAQTIITS
jgi:hypothetical protein